MPAGLRRPHALKPADTRTAFFKKSLSHRETENQTEVRLACGARAKRSNRLQIDPVRLKPRSPSLAQTIQRPESLNSMGAMVIRSAAPISRLSRFSRFPFLGVRLHASGTATKWGFRLDMLAHNFPQLFCSWFYAKTRTSVRGKMSMRCWLNSLGLGEVMRM